MAHLPEDLVKYFEYLDELRESGVTNMFGAGAYVEREFMLPKDEAREVTILWMNTFSDAPAEDRAQAAMEKAN